MPSLMVTILFNADILSAVIIFSSIKNKCIILFSAFILTFLKVVPGCGVAHGAKYSHASLNNGIVLRYVLFDDFVNV